MDSALSQPPPKIKKGISQVKGFSAIVTQSLQTVPLHFQVPTSIPSSQSSKQPEVASAAWPQSPLQALEQEEYKPDTSSSSFTAITRSDKPTETGEQAAPPTSPSESWSKKLANSCLFLTQQQKKTINWA